MVQQVSLQPWVLLERAFLTLPTGAEGDTSIRPLTFVPNDAAVGQSESRIVEALPDVLVRMLRARGVCGWR